MKKLSFFLFLLGMLGAHLGFAQQSTTDSGRIT